MLCFVKVSKETLTTSSQRCSQGFEVDRTGDAHDFGFCFFYLVCLLFPVVGLTNRKFQQVESVSRIQI